MDFSTRDPKKNVQIFLKDVGEALDTTFSDLVVAFHTYEKKLFIEYAVTNSKRK